MPTAALQPLSRESPAKASGSSRGLVDLQVNGYHGDNLNADDLTVETVRSLAGRMLATGVTTFLPTLITASDEKILRSLRIIAAAREADPLRCT